MRGRVVVALLLWSSSGIALGQEPPAESQSLSTGQVLDPGAYPQLAPPSAAWPTTQAATGAPDVGAAEADPISTPTLADLAEKVDALSRKLTVVTADESFKLVLGGNVTADFLFSTQRPVAPGTPFFLAPGSPFGFNTSTFDAHARQTTFFAFFSGPKVGSFETGGLIAANLYNDAVIVDRYGFLPIEAFGQLQNEDWRIAAGQQLGIFSPRLPTFLAFSYLAGSGNAGIYRGQFRVERFLRPAEEVQITLIAGLSEPISTFLQQDTLSEDNGWPNVEGRFVVGLGESRGEGLLRHRPFEIAASGVIGEIRTTELDRRQVDQIWGVGSDLRWEITPRFGVKGEVFVGETLGTYGGAVLQNINLETFKGIRTSGGWGEVYCYIVPEKLHTHAGYAIDDPLDQDLALTQRTRNETYFANLIWEVNKAVRLGFEVTYRETQYKGLGITKAPSSTPGCNGASKPG